MTTGAIWPVTASLVSQRNPNGIYFEKLNFGKKVKEICESSGIETSCKW